MTDNLNSIIHKIQNSQQGIEDLKSFFQPEIIDGKSVNKKEITIDKSTFAIALQHKDTKGAVIHEILLHFVQSPDKQSLENVIKHLDKAIRDRIYAKNNPIGNPNEEFRTHMNFKGEGSNTLLHQAVISNNTEAITSLLKYGANSLIKNKEGKTPLDLTQGKTKEAKKALVDGMKEQAKSKKESARCSSLIGIIPGAFLGIGCGLGAAIGAGSALAGSSMAIMLGAIAVSALIVGIAVGLAIYFLSQDRAQAKAIEKVVNSKLSSINDKMSNMTADDKAAPELPQVSV